MKTFEDEKFEGYTFECDTVVANMGFKHLCKVYDKNHDEVEQAKAVINWGNRTWESFLYQAVLTEAKAKLEEHLNPKENDELEYDTDFLYKLQEEYYITDFGYTDSGELLILFDNWTQARGRERYDEEKHEWIQYDVSVYAKLQALAEKGLLKPAINKTINEVEFGFTDSLAKCDECGRIFSTECNELTVVDYRFLCQECIENDDEAIQELIKNAHDDFRQALKPTISDDKLEELGFVKLNEESFSLSQAQWGETRWGYDYIDLDFAEELCEVYDGFAKIDSVQQFDAPFSIWVNSYYEDEARESLKAGYIVVAEEE